MGTLEEIGRHLVLALKPLKDAVSSQDNFRQFIYRLGWNANSLPPSYIALATKVDDCKFPIAKMRFCALSRHDRLESARI